MEGVVCIDTQQNTEKIEQKGMTINKAKTSKEKSFKKLLEIAESQTSNIADKINAQNDSIFWMLLSPFYLNFPIADLRDFQDFINLNSSDIEGLEKKTILTPLQLTPFINEDIEEKILPLLNEIISEYKTDKEIDGEKFDKLLELFKLNDEVKKVGLKEKLQQVIKKANAEAFTEVDVYKYSKENLENFVKKYVNNPENSLNRNEKFVLTEIQKDSNKVFVSKSNEDKPIILLPIVNKVEGLKMETIDALEISKSPLQKDEIENNKFIEEIAEKIVFLAKDKIKELHIRLKPDYLGEMLIKIVNEGKNLKAQIFVENSNVRKDLEIGLESIKNHIEKQGFDNVNIELLNVKGEMGFNNDLFNKDRDNFYKAQKQKGSFRIEEIKEPSDLDKGMLMNHGKIIYSNYYQNSIDYFV
ncbi:MAG: flagellar hook-length control protein FliK [Thermovenabulum sp.]|uniref:flagellar hook-length control protein FliK n=1 Tax=Thermovenabulum sp. TaxID=3100335 RepID=UPI003C7DECBB